MHPSDLPVGLPDRLLVRHVRAAHLESGGGEQSRHGSGRRHERRGVHDPHLQEELLDGHGQPRLGDGFVVRRTQQLHDRVVDLRWLRQVSARHAPLAQVNGHHAVRRDVTQPAGRADPRARGDRHGRAVLQRHLVAAPEAVQVRSEKQEVVVALLRRELVGEDHVVGQRLDVDDDVAREDLERAVLADDVLLNAVEQELDDGVVDRDAEPVTDTLVELVERQGAVGADDVDERLLDLLAGGEWQPFQRCEVVGLLERRVVVERRHERGREAEGELAQDALTVEAGGEQAARRTPHLRRVVVGDLVGDHLAHGVLEGRSWLIGVDPADEELAALVRVVGVRPSREVVEKERHLLRIHGGDATDGCRCHAEFSFTVGQPGASRRDPSRQGRG